MNSVGKKKIAVIGSGISGIAASYLLSSKYNVHLFEKNNRLGGHTRTINVLSDNNLAIDTGFIVFNDKNYPDLVKFFNHIDVLTANSDMSFAVSDNFRNIEYSGKNFKTLFAQYKNIFNPQYIKMIFEIYKFYKLCKNTNLNALNEYITIDKFLDLNNFSSYVRKLHIYPLLSSIWSNNHNDVLNFPLKLFLNFFNNHDLFNFKNRPQWKYVLGGSNTYIKKILDLKLFNYTLNSNISEIIRSKNQIKIIKENGDEKFFDFLVIATHADQALKLLQHPTDEEKNVLSNFDYTNNSAYLHSDDDLMPKNIKTWSSWNFINNAESDENYTLTYWMNNLQNLKSDKEYFVTINPSKVPKKIHNETVFQHPKFSINTSESQNKIRNLQGVNNTFFCGSYQGFGFHEDGIQSAAFVAKMMGIDLPWDRDKNFYNRLQFDIK